MQPLSPHASPGFFPTPTSQTDTSTEEITATDQLVPPQYLNGPDQLIVNHQRLILSAVEMVRCLKTCFNDNSTDHFEELVQTFALLTNRQEQSDHLKKIVWALEDYFPTSKIYRPEGKERWEAAEAVKAISNLSSADKKSLIEILRICNVEESVPLNITPNSYVFVLGATVPGMKKRLNYLTCECDNLTPSGAYNLTPKKLFGVVSSRLINPEQDRLEHKKTINMFNDALETFSEQYHLGENNKPTEAHGFMALAYTLCYYNSYHLIYRMPNMVCYTGPVSYKPQTLQPNGQYILQDETQTGRANTETTIKSALDSLNLPKGAELVLVSSQPHVAAQLIAGERVAALLDLDLKITAGGMRKALSDRDDTSIFQAIDALRKAIQLLNPNYQIITNQTSSPESRLIYTAIIENTWDVQQNPTLDALV